MTYNFRENDHKLAEYIGGVLDRIARAMNPTTMSSPNVRRGNYNVVPYQSTHNTGGTITGTDPKTSVVNRYLQSWDADNLFVMGASVFPQNASYNPTGLVGALAYYSADGDHRPVSQAAGPARAGLISRAGIRSGWDADPLPARGERERSLHVRSRAR